MFGVILLLAGVASAIAGMQWNEKRKTAKATADEKARKQAARTWAEAQAALEPTTLGSPVKAAPARRTRAPAKSTRRTPPVAPVSSTYEDNSSDDLVVATVVSTILDDTPSRDDTPTDFNAGGGDFGGGGASESWSAPETSRYESSSSYDSPSDNQSYSGGGSSDGGSSGGD